MSIGRPDPNALKVIAPDAYSQNLAEIARAKATLEAFEQMNEAGKANYDKLMEQEELELEQKIQDGLLARQRLQQLRNMRSTGLLENGPRIEEVGSTNSNAYDLRGHSTHPPMVSPSFPPTQNTFTSQFQPNTLPVNSNSQFHPPQQYTHSNQPLNQSHASTSYNPRSSQSMSSSGSAQRTNVAYYPTSNTSQGHPNMFNPNQYPPHQAPGYQYVHYQQPPIQVQHSDRPPQPSMAPPQPQEQLFSNSQYQYHLPRNNTSTSSLVDALGASSSSKTQPTVANVNPASNKPAGAAPPVSSTIPLMASSSRSRDSIGHSSQKTAPVPARKDPAITIPVKPTRTQINHFNNYFTAWASRVSPQSEYTGPITCGTYLIKCIKHTDGSVRFIFTLSTGAVHMLASNFLEGLLSTATRPVDHPSLESNIAATKSSASTTQPPVNAQGSASTSAPHAPANQRQDIPPQVIAIDNIASSSNIPNGHSVPTPQTPPKKTPQRPGTIMSPKHADKTRIAQSVLFALGKRRREDSNIPETSMPASKRPALATAANETSQNVSSTSVAESSKKDSKDHSEPEPTNAIPPKAPSTAPESQALPENMTQPFTVPIVPANPSSYGSANHQPYGQGSSSAPQQPSYVKFTPLNPYSAWKNHTATDLSGSQAAPQSLVEIGKSILASQTQKPAPQTFEKIPNLLHSQNSTSSNTNNTILPSVEGTLSSQEKASSQQTQTVPGTIPTPSSAAKLTPTVSQSSDSAGAIKRTDDMIPKITYLKTPSRKSPEPVASSSKLAPTKEPLFLPSPSVEPEDDLWNAAIDDETLNTTPRAAPKMPKVNRAYVLVPAAPEYVVRYRQQKNKKRESRPSSTSETRRRNGTWTDSSVATPFEEEDFSYSAESQLDSVFEEQEREAIKVACSRLQVSPCRWDGCDAEMNSVEALIRHLNTHKPAPTQQTKTFMCRWKQCGQQGIKFDDVHLQKHALLPLRCAYTDCDDTFRSPAQLVKHFRTRHSNDALKPSAKLAAPSTLPDLPPIPGIIPSYLVVTSLAGREVLSKERHNIIGPQVLRGMTSEQNSLTRRSRKNARPASRPAVPVARTDLTNDYLFLEDNNAARSSTYFSRPYNLELSDLDTDSVVKIVEEGVVLLNSDDGHDTKVEVEASPSPPSSPLQRREERGGIRIGPSLEKELDHGASADGQDEYNSEEDAAVETMLTDVTSMGPSTL